MKQLFHIHSAAAVDASQCVLVMEVGERHFYFGIMSQSSRELQQIGFYSAEEIDEWNFLAAIFEKHTILSESFYQTIIGYHFSESILVPQQIYNYENASQLLRSLHTGMGKAVIVSEWVPQWDLHNIYQVPTPVHDWMKLYFTGSKFWHSYSVGLKNINRPEAGTSQFIVEFKPDAFTLFVVKNSVLQLVQIITYETPEDVLYSLLKVCKQFSISQNEVNVKIGGAVDQESALYRQLWKYFVHVELISRPSGIRLHEVFKEQPEHFFSAIFNLCACVS